MNCNEARRHWNLYHDSEGDPELYFQINEHLDGCPDCAEWFHHQDRWEELIAEHLRGSTVTPPTLELWTSVLARTGLEHPVTARRQFFLKGLLGLAAGLLVAVGLWSLFLTQARAEGDLSKLTAEYHGQFVDGRKTVQFVSHSDLEVEDHLRRQVNFPVHCPPRRDSGFLVQGAGVCREPGCEVVYLVGHVEESPVSIFILSRDDLAGFPRQLEAIRREGTHRSRDGDYEMVMTKFDRNVVLVVGRTDPERLMRVLRAYGSYPGHPI